MFDQLEYPQSAVCFYVYREEKGHAPSGVETLTSSIPEYNSYLDYTCKIGLASFVTQSDMFL